MLSIDRAGFPDYVGVETKLSFFFFCRGSLCGSLDGREYVSCSFRLWVAWYHLKIEFWEWFIFVILILEERVFKGMLLQCLKLWDTYPCLLSRLSFSYCLPKYYGKKNCALLLCWRDVCLSKGLCFGFWFILLFYNNLWDSGLGKLLLKAGVVGERWLKIFWQFSAT